MKAIAYCRVSTDLQDYNRQVSQVTDYCLVNNVDLIEIYPETASGKNNERPELLRMIEYIKSTKDLDFVVTSELSRLGRNSKTIEILELLNKKQIGLVSLKENISTLNQDKTINHSSSLILNIINSINAFELDTFKYRVKSGHKHQIESGRAPGSDMMPYGYIKIGLKKQSKLMIDEEDEAEIVRMIFNLYLNEGYGTRKIAGILNDKGIKTRKAKLIEAGKKFKKHLNTDWSDGTINGMLNNKIYIGKRKHRTKKIEGFKQKFEYEEFDQPDLRIISDEQFFAVRKRLTENYSKAGHFTVHNYLLEVRKIKCGCCGKFYIRQKLASQAHKAKYICSTRRTKSLPCKNYSIRIENLDRLIQYVIFQNHSEILFNNLSSNEFDKKIKDLEIDLEVFKKDFNNELKRESKLVNMSLNDKISPDIFSSILKEIKKEQDSITNKIRITEQQLKDNKEAFEKLTDIGKLKINFNTKNEQLPAPVINKIINQITITKIENTPKELQSLISIIYKKYDDFDSSLHIQDRLIFVAITAGNTILHYIMAQQNFHIFDVTKKNIFIAGFKGDKKSGEWFHHLDVNYSDNLIRWLKLN